LSKQYLADGKLVMHPTHKPLKVKQIDSIGIWTDAFINYAKVVIDILPYKQTKSVNNRKTVKT
jgi:hypothetical protein